MAANLQKKKVQNLQPFVDSAIMPFEDYNVHECVGRGTFGDVYKAFSKKAGGLVAIKVINLDESSEDIHTLIQEIQFLSRLRSEFITKYMETFVRDMSMWIVMEYCGGGSCADLLKCHKKLNEDVTALIIRDVLKGLTYLHSQKKVHRDIKLANILLTSDGSVKLADFGVSGEITMTHLKRNTFVGTPFWMAPEVITRNNTGYNEKADIWSTGITTIELVTGSPPLSGNNPLKILFEIPKKKPPVLTGVDFSENIKDFIKYCLIKDPTKRPSSSTLLHHRFITNIKRHISLLPLIEQKNIWYEKNHLVRRPKNDLRFDDSTNYQQIQWDFDSIRRSQRIQTRNPSPMQQTLLRHQGIGLIELQGNSSNQVQISAGTSAVAETSHTAATTDITTTTGIDTDSGAVGSSATPITHPMEYNYHDIYLYCLQRVKLRAKTASTKKAVEDLMSYINECEYQQPGLSEALLEEILKFKYLVVEREGEC